MEIFNCLLKLYFVYYCIQLEIEVHTVLSGKMISYLSIFSSSFLQ